MTPKIKIQPKHLKYWNAPNTTLITEKNINSTETSEVLKQFLLFQRQKWKLKFNRNIWSIETFNYHYRQIWAISNSTETSEVLKHHINIVVTFFTSKNSTETSEVLKLKRFKSKNITYFLIQPKHLKYWNSKLRTSAL